MIQAQADSSALSIKVETLEARIKSMQDQTEQLQEQLVAKEQKVCNVAAFFCTPI